MGGIVELVTTTELLIAVGLELGIKLVVEVDKVNDRKKGEVLGVR